MTQTTFLALIFFTSLLTLALWKQLLWLYWKAKRLQTQEQAFTLLAKHRFIEITGSSGTGKSWLLMHLFKHLSAVKFTNAPTPQSTYTLTKQILETHLSGQWAAPNKWYYFLDDINIWQKWAQQEFGAGYTILQDYLTQAGKLGGTFIWTNNGIEPEHLLATQKNQTWTVLGYTTFLERYSLITLKTQGNWYNFLPTIIAIDNQELKAFYDPHWNISTTYQTNWLQYIFGQKLHAEEGLAILAAIKESSLALSEDEWAKQVKFDRNLLLNYLKVQNKKEELVRKKKQQFQKVRKDIDKYGLAGKEITFKDVERWDKEDKGKKRVKGEQVKNGNEKPVSIVEENLGNNSSPDLDQLHQDPNEEANESEE